MKIVRYVQKYGKRWSKIIIELGHRRTEHMVKNRFNSLIRKAQTNRKQK